MYTVYVDGQLLFSTELDDGEHIILSPRVDMDINGAGSFSFVMPPGNPFYDAIRKLKSIITVKMDDEIIFRGRAMDDERDIYNQKNVYCEGDRSFLLDSLHKPYSYTGNVQEFFRQLVSNHNDQVDADKQFTVGRITAVSSDSTMDAEDDDYTDTASRIEDRLLGAYGGYIKTRTEDGITYLDWLTKEADPDDQTVEFGVNLLDIKNKLDASEVFTCLIPLGESSVDSDGEYTPPLTIASVNGGLDYIQDDDAVAMYGKIWRTQTWAYEDDPAELLQKGLEFMKTGIAVQTLTLQFIDMHFTDRSRKRVFIGDHPRILSEPHALNISPICVKASLELVNPEKSTYTFGEAPKTLTENFIEADEDLGSLTGRRGGGGGVKVNLDELKRWAIIQVNMEQASIDLLTHDQNELTNRVSNAEIRLDGIDAEILLKADRELVNDLETRVTSAEIAIDGANANILLKADATIVDALGSRVESAEIEIDGMNSEITLKADKVYVDAQVTNVKTLIADEIEAVYSDVNYSIAESVSTKSLTVSGNAWVQGTMTAVSTSTGALTLNGSSVSTTTIPVVTSFTQASGESADTTDYTLLTTAVGDVITHDIAAGETKTFDAA